LMLAAVIRFIYSAHAIPTALIPTPVHGAAPVNVATAAETEGVLVPAGSVALIFAVMLRAVQTSCTRAPNSGRKVNRVRLHLVRDLIG
jgi:hypothetical protein